jgi:hypothetical protein
MTMGLFGQKDEPKREAAATPEIAAKQAAAGEGPKCHAARDSHLKRQIERLYGDKRLSKSDAAFLARVDSDLAKDGEIHNRATLARFHAIERLYP